MTLLGIASGVIAGLAGCVTQAPVERAPVAATAPVAPTSLTDAAVAALQAAEQSVTDARAKRTLWTSAQERLTQARLAAKNFDSAATIAHAEEVVKLCALSIQQLQSPPVKW